MKKEKLRTRMWSKSPCWKRRIVRCFPPVVFLSSSLRLLAAITPSCVPIPLTFAFSSLLLHSGSESLISGNNVQQVLYNSSYDPFHKPPSEAQQDFLNDLMREMWEERKALLSGTFNNGVMRRTTCEVARLIGLEDHRDVQEAAGGRKVTPLQEGPGGRASSCHRNQPGR